MPTFTTPITNQHNSNSYKLSIKHTTKSCKDNYQGWVNLKIFSTIQKGHNLNKVLFFKSCSKKWGHHGTFKMRIHFQVLGFTILYFPTFMKKCLNLEKTFLTCSFHHTPTLVANLKLWL